MSNKMTDNEIIKGLECCVKITTDCENCPYWGISKVENCFDVAKQDAVDLINRQKAEIERLLTENHSLAIVQEGFKDMYKIAEAEAVKEFAERLKEKAKRGKGYLGNVYCSVTVAEIDKTYKEMVGENGGT